MSFHGKIAPGPRDIFKAFRDDPIGALMAARRDYGDVVRMKLSSITHLVSNPIDVKYVLQDNHNNYVRNTSFVQGLRAAIGNGLLVSNGSFWLRQRRIVQPGFSRERIAGFAQIMATCGEQLADRWSELAARGEALDLVPEFTELTLQVLGLTLFGKDLAFAADELSRAVRIVSDQTAARVVSLASAHRTPDNPSNAEFLEARAIVRDVANSLIDERRADPVDRGDVLSMLLRARDPETGEAMSDEEVADELMHFITAGHETTTVAFSWTCFSLARHAHVYDRLREELQRVLGGRTPRFDDMTNLPYLRACVEETLRVYPPVWLFGRRAVGDDVIQDFHIPAGSTVALAAYVTHRHEGFWTDPETFEPERFLRPDAARPRYAYFPFGGGPHLCVGNHFALLELSLVVAILAQRFRFELMDTPPVEPYASIALRPRHGVVVKLHQI